MSDIFIAYSRTDGAVARRLAERLRAVGWSVFMDVQTAVGERWHKKIEKELLAARAVVALWSATSRDSDFVLEEAEYAKRKEILFPVFIEHVEYPYGFRRIQTADLMGWDGDTEHPGLAELLESLREHLNSRGPTPGTGDVLHAEVVVPSKPTPPAPARVLAPGQTFRDPLKSGGKGPSMVVIPAGRFRMGSPPDEPERVDREGPQHEVRIATPFAMGVYAVTFEDYDLFCKNTKREKPKDQGWGRDRRPVINVSWEDVRAYCGWLGEETGRTYRLPSEAEWEYACRAGTETPFHFGATFTTDQANFDGNYTYNGSTQGEYRQKTVPVGSFPPNAFGLYDMHGNVWEWCQDAWHESYDGAPSDGSPWGGGKGQSRVLRGGSWYFKPRRCRAAYRHNNPPGFRYDSVGFRVCCSAPIE
jgi:formylglycine-generating enzyme required for sulfatase activity